VTGHVNGVSQICKVDVPSISGCTILVSPTGGTFSTILRITYSNTTGTFDVATTGQALSASWSSCGSLFGSASSPSPVAATYTNASGGDLLYTVTSPAPPLNPTITVF
jgi:hypothetical protein